MDSVDNSLQTKANLVVWLPHDCHKYIPLINNQFQASNGRYQIIRELENFITEGSSMFWYNVFITFSTEVCALPMEDLVPMQSEMNMYRKIKCIVDWILPLVKTCIITRWGGRNKHLKFCRKEENLHVFFFL